MIWNQAAAKTRSCCSFRFLAAAVCSVFSTLCLPLQASAGSAVPAGRERRLLHHAPPGSPQGGPGLAGRLDPHQGHPQPPAHPGHRRPAPAAPTMTTAHCCTQTARTVTPPLCQTTGGKKRGRGKKRRGWGGRWDGQHERFTGSSPGSVPRQTDVPRREMEASCTRPPPPRGPTTQI